MQLSFGNTPNPTPPPTVPYPIVPTTNPTTSVIPFPIGVEVSSEYQAEDRLAREARGDNHYSSSPSPPLSHSTRITAYVSQVYEGKQKIKCIPIAIVSRACVLPIRTIRGERARIRFRPSIAEGEAYRKTKCILDLTPVANPVPKPKPQ
jgi:hypothetical protein